MSDISPSSIKVTKSLEEQLQGVTNSEQIKEIMKNEAISQNLAHREWDDTILTPNEPGTVARGFARAITIDGTKHIVQATSELELEKAVGDLYRAQLQPATTQQIEQPQPRNERGQFTATEQGVSEDQKAALSLQMQLGQIDIATYLERSGAVADYLEKAGVPIEDLKSAVAEKQGERITHSWESATQEFLNSPAGNWWPGGEFNREKVGKVLIEMGAEDSPSAENLRRAAEYLRDSNQLVEPPEVAARNREVEAQQRIGSATSVEEIREALGGRSSSVFGR